MLHSIALQCLRMIGIVLILAFATKPVLGQSDCGKYRECRRVAVLPWYAAGLGEWQTEFIVSSKEPVNFGYMASFALKYDGIGHNLNLHDQERGAFIAESVDGVDLGGGRLYAAQVLGGTSCGFGSCGTDPGISTGSLIMTFDGSDAALDSLSTQAMYKCFTTDGSVASQAVAPIIFVDEASNRWSSIITDTPMSQRTRRGATSVYFAVANLDPTPQAVLIEVFDDSGRLVVSGATPVLEEFGLYAGGLSDVLGANFVPSARNPDFQGKLVLRSFGGGKIAPVVVQASWPAFTVLPAKPE